MPPNMTAGKSIRNQRGVGDTPLKFFQERCLTFAMTDDMKEVIKHKIRHNLQRMRTSVKWVIFAIISGIVVGLVGTAFYFCMDTVTRLRGSHPWLIWLLPVGGLVIVGAYHLLHDEKDTGTNLVISSIHSGDNLPLRMAPLIFISTLITHLLGGSAGREGAALQLGGSIGNEIGKLFKFDEKDKHIMTMCGMSAAFSALFGTPMAAAIFSMEVVSVGIMYYAALVPCVIAALIAHGIAGYFGAEAEIFLLSALPEFIVGDQRYNGSGIALIEPCMEGEVAPEMFLLKMLFTAATLGAGFKGGEIVPSFCIGGTFGCLFAKLMGFSPSLCTAVGMTAVFCGVTNCPISSLLISFEMFGYEGMPYFLLTIAFSYMLSGYFGLYHSQKIMYSKYKTNYINKKAV